MPTILHLLDPTTPPDACNMLAHLLSNTPSSHHHLAALGHRSTANLTQAAGITHPITFIPSLGWADPTTWRCLEKLLAKIQPTHLHAWGLPAALAASLSRPPIVNSPRRLCTLAEPPAPRYLRPLKFLQRVKPRTENCRFHFITTNNAIADSLTSARIDATRITQVPPTIPQNTTPLPDPALLREQLGLTLEDQPLILLAGEGGAAGTRHDYGLWTAAILNMIFPNVRAIAREDPRNRPDPGLDRMADNLHDDRIPIILPAEYSWQQLLTIAGLFLITADRPIALGDTLMAIAAGIPILAPPPNPRHPNDTLYKILRDGDTALIAREPKPRSLAARAQEFLSHPELRAPLIERARAHINQIFPPEKMLQAFHSLYNKYTEPPLEFSTTPAVSPA